MTQAYRGPKSAKGGKSPGVLTWKPGAPGRQDIVSSARKFKTASDEFPIYITRGVCGHALLELELASTPLEFALMSRFVQLVSFRYRQNDDHHTDSTDTTSRNERPADRCS